MHSFLSTLVIVPTLSFFLTFTLAASNGTQTESIIMQNGPMRDMLLAALKSNDKNQMAETIEKILFGCKIYDQLYDACKRGNKETMEKLWSSDIDVHHPRNNQTMLQVACAAGNEAVVTYLLHKGADMNAQCRISLSVDESTIPEEYSHVSALGIACLYKDIHVVRALVKFGADINQCCCKDSMDNELFPLHIACLTAKPELIDYLLSLCALRKNYYGRERQNRIIETLLFMRGAHYLRWLSNGQKNAIVDFDTECKRSNLSDMNTAKLFNKKFSLLAKKTGFDCAYCMIRTAATYPGLFLELLKDSTAAQCIKNVLINYHSAVDEWAQLARIDQQKAQRLNAFRDVIKTGVLHDIVYEFKY